MTIDQNLNLETAIAGWCKQRPDIRAVIVIGSRGRRDQSADQYSDLDLILFSSSVDRYVLKADWLEQFGKLWIATLNRIGPGDPEWMAFYAPGIKTDFLLVSATSDQSITSALESLPYQQVLSRGFRVLYQSAADSGERVDLPVRKVPVSVPTEEIFYRELNAMLFTAARFVKFSLRGDTWRSRYTYEAELKSHLLKFIEWHAQLVGKPGADTWYEGRNISSWADQRAIAALPRLTLGQEPSQRQETLEAYLELVEMLAAETASWLGYIYPTGGQSAMIAWLLAILRQGS